MKTKLLVLFLTIILIIIYWQWFLPGSKVANDFPSVSKPLLKYSLNLPFAWSETGAEGIGEYSTFFLWGWPLSLIFGVLANLGFGFVFLEKVFFLIPILIIGAIGMWKLSKYFHLSNIACFISSIFYLSNTYLILLIDGGQMSIALAYAWFPISFLLLRRSIDNGFKKRILAGIAAAVLGFFDIRFVYILIFLSLINFLYQLLFITKRGTPVFFAGWVKSGVVISLVVLGLHCFWVYPVFKDPISAQTYQFFTQTSFLSLVNLGHSLLALTPHWFSNVFGRITPLRFEFIFIPILILLAPMLKPKNRDVGFWLIVAIVSVFLAKGTSEPFPQAYLWLFDHLPGFSLFRDSTKFFFLVMLAYSILIGISIEAIISKTRGFKRMKGVILAAAVFYLLFLLRPVLLKQMTGTFSSPLFEKEYTGLANFLEKDKVFGRVFWIPSFPPLGYSDLKHPRVEAARAMQKRPFGIGTKGTYETFNFLREASFMGEIFDVAGISYIAYPFLDSRRDNMHTDNIKYYYTFLNQLSKKPWLTRIDNFAIPLLQTKQHQDRFFITPNIWWVIGSDSIYNEATKSANLKLSKNALIFAEEYQGLSKRLDEFPEAKIVLNNKTDLDLAASFIDSSSLIFPANGLKHDPDASGWWKREAVDLISWRFFLRDKYKIDNQDFDLGGGWAVGEGSREFQISNIKYQKDNILLARVMESSRSGVLTFYQNNQTVGSISTKVNGGTNIRWFEVGKLNSAQELTIISEGAINVINALAVIREEDWLEDLNRVKQYQGQVISFNEKNIEKMTGKATYQQINPTKYKVSVRGLTAPALLVFSENYDSLWKLGDQQPFPVYSLLNGFRINVDGDYLVEFEAQKYVYIGLIVTGLTILSLITFLIFTTIKKTKL